jgi:hypothetical protein
MECHRGLLHHEFGGLKCVCVCVCVLCNSACGSALVCSLQNTTHDDAGRKGFLEQLGALALEL